jgi:hypothetical protein
VLLGATMSAEKSWAGSSEVLVPAATMRSGSPWLIAMIPDTTLEPATSRSPLTSCGITVAPPLDEEISRSIPALAKWPCSSP